MRHIALNLYDRCSNGPELGVWEYVYSDSFLGRGDTLVEVVLFETDELLKNKSIEFVDFVASEENQAEHRYGTVSKNLSDFLAEKRHWANAADEDMEPARIRYCKIQERSHEYA